MKRTEFRNGNKNVRVCVCVCTACRDAQAHTHGQTDTHTHTHGEMDLADNRAAQLSAPGPCVILYATVHADRKSVV